MIHTPKKSFNSPGKYLTKSSGPKPHNSPASDEGGRFIPNRVSSNLKILFEKAEIDPASELGEDPRNKFSDFLQSQLFLSPSRDNKPSSSLFKYRPPLFPTIENKENQPLSIFQPSCSFEIQSMRNFSRTPFKILDAPNLKDDFYIDVVSWSSKNIIAIGLYNEVYLWYADSLKVKNLCNFPNDSVSSVSWNDSGEYLAIGTEKGKLCIYDINSLNLIHSINNHSYRIGTLSWNRNLVSSGSRDGHIVHQDLISGTVCSKVFAHRQEICKIKWSPSGDYLVSGGNDNRIMLWNSLNSNPVNALVGHNAAVKALDWCPFSSSTVASGGGTADKTVRLWNIHTCEQTFMVETNSQVCNLKFSHNTHELITSHGYSENLINIWKYPSMQLVGELKGHNNRVLFMDLSPDKETVVTGAGDETLRFWNIFPSPDDREIVDSTVALSLYDVR